MRPKCGRTDIIKKLFAPRQTTFECNPLAEYVTVSESSPTLNSLAQIFPQSSDSARWNFVQLIPGSWAWRLRQACGTYSLPLQPSITKLFTLQDHSRHASHSRCSSLSVIGLLFVWLTDALHYQCDSYNLAHNYIQMSV
jgi:hypothetical protein